MVMNLSVNPLVSVCMPCYNDACYLAESINSILSQSFDDFELLIVDDGSEDESIQVIESYHDHRIRLIRNEHDFIGSLNLLLQEAKGKYIARMDSDDIMFPDRLLIQFNYMEENPDLDILGGGMEFFGGRRGMFLPMVRERRLELKDFIDGNILAHPTVMCRCKSLQQYSLAYRKEYIYAEDYKLWIEALNNGLSVDNLQTVFIKYRVSPKQNSSKYYTQQKAIVSKLKQEIATLIESSENIIS